eukprot:COSAG05_NODE_13886_length_415_cov_0.816456_1_plen_54_part_01
MRALSAFCSALARHKTVTSVRTVLVEHQAACVQARAMFARVWCVTGSALHPSQC